MASETTTVSTDAAAKPTRAQRSVWRPQQERSGWWRSRGLRRTGMTILFLAMLAGLFWLVFPPLYHPFTQLVFLTGGDYRPLKAPPATFAMEDYGALEPLRSVLYNPPPDPGTTAEDVDRPPLLFSQMSSASEMRSLSTSLSDVTPEQDGVLIVYVDGHGVSDNGTAYVLCRDFDPANPSAGRLRAAELLRQVSDTPAKVKLLILDSGRIESDPRVGMVVNEFPRLLEEEVAQTGDPNLWVLNSNAVLQRSHVSWALERSVFGYFIAQGLQGAADLNGDRTVDVNELYRFVRANVAAWVQESTAGREAQTPVLLWGGGETLPSGGYPVLLPTVNSGGSGGIKLPSTKGAFPQVPDATPLTPYANSAQANFVPVVASSQKKVPGLKQARKTAKVSKKLSRKAQEADARNKSEAAAAKADQPTDTKSPDVKSADPKAADTKSSDARADGDKAAEKPGEGKATSGNAPTDKPSGEKSADDKAGEKKDGDKSPTPGPPGASAEKPPGATKSKPAPPPSAGDLLVEGWQLRDEFETSTGNRARPIDYAPAAWREYQEWLLAQEQLYRAGEIADQAKLGRLLQKSLGRLANLPNPGPLEADRPPDLAARIGSVRPRLPSKVDAPGSLAMAQLFADQNGSPLPDEIAAITTTLDRFTHDGTPAELTAWLAKLNPAFDRFSEIRFARQLSKLVGVDGAVVQLAIGTRRSSEVVATIDPAVLPWIRERVEAADQLRLAGEKILIDAVDDDRQAQATNQFRRANDQYHQAADDASVVAGAIQFRNDLLNRAPYYVSWRAAAPESPDAPKQTDILDFLRLVGQLDAALYGHDFSSQPAETTQIDQLIKLTGQIATVVDSLDAGLSDNTIDALAGKTPGPGSSLRIDALLSTPLLGSDARSRLLGAAGDADSRLAARFKPATIGSIDETPPTGDAARWQAVIDRTELELALVRLIVGPTPSGQSGLGMSLAVLSPLGGGATPQANDLHSLQSQSQSINARYQAARALGAALAEFYHELPSQIETTVEKSADLSDPATRSKRLSALQNADRMLRLVDIRDAGRATKLSPTAQLSAAAMYDLLVWQERRMSSAIVDAKPIDVEYLTVAETSYRDQATRIPLQPTSAAGSDIALSIAGPTSLNLSTEPEQLVELVARSNSGDAIDVWIVLRYATDLIEVQSAASGHVYLEHQIRSDAAAAGHPLPVGEILHPDRLGLAPTFKLRPNSSESIHCKVRMKTGSKLPTPLIAKVISAQSAVRHETEILLPAPQMIELVVDGGVATSLNATDKLTLYPFPNRKTDFRLSLVNNGQTDRTVDVELFGLLGAPTFAPPTAPLEAVDADRVMARVGPVKSLALMSKVSLPAGSKPVAIPFPGPGGDKKVPPPEEGKGPPRPLFEHGLLIVTTDRESHAKNFRRIDIAPQRPRKYVRPRVGYDLDRETVQINVTPIDAKLLPPGPVKIHADITPPLSPTAQTQLDAELAAPDYTANLFAEVAADAAKTLTLRLKVDGYPRAFVYRIPCGIQSSDLPEQTDLREVRITHPPAEKAYKAPIEYIPVEAEVDAPLSAFQNPDDILEIGIDVDRDRDLRNEPSVRLTTDREVKILLDPWTTPGTLTLDSLVGDFHLTVPAPSLRNARVSVLGRIFSGGKTGWSQPVDILLDGAPPNIERVEFKPAIPVLGPDVEVSVWATDNDLSGVDRVEAAFDPVGHGKFDDVVEAIELFKDDAGRWSAKLPTKNLSIGDLSLIVRATDKVGNKSDYTKVKVHLISKVEADTAAEAPNGKLQGIVTFGDKPWPQVELMLTSEKGPKIPAVTSDAQGGFTFSGVPPGKYKLSAKGTVHNKVRKVEQDATVESGVANPKPTKVNLK